MPGTALHQVQIIQSHGTAINCPPGSSKFKESGESAVTKIRKQDYFGGRKVILSCGFETGSLYTRLVWNSDPRASASSAGVTWSLASLLSLKQDYIMQAKLAFSSQGSLCLHLLCYIKLNIFCLSRIPG